DWSAGSSTTRPPSTHNNLNRNRSHTSAGRGSDGGGARGLWPSENGRQHPGDNFRFTLADHQELRAPAERLKRDISYTAGCRFEFGQGHQEPQVRGPPILAFVALGSFRGPFSAMTPD